MVDDETLGRLRVAKLKAEALFDAAGRRLERANREYKNKQEDYRDAVDAYLAALEGEEGEYAPL